MNVNWDLEKARANLTKHGVDFADAAVALEDENALTIPGKDHLEERFKTLAMSPNIDVLLIVPAEQDEQSIRLISARKADRSQREAYFKGDYHE